MFLIVPDYSFWCLQICETRWNLFGEHKPTDAKPQNATQCFQWNTPNRVFNYTIENVRVLTSFFFYFHRLFHFWSSQSLTRLETIRIFVTIQRSIVFYYSDFVYVFVSVIQMSFDNCQSVSWCICTSDWLIMWRTVENFF